MAGLGSVLTIASHNDGFHGDSAFQQNQSFARWPNFAHLATLMPGGSPQSVPVPLHGKSLKGCMVQTRQQAGRSTGIPNSARESETPKSRALSGLLVAQRINRESGDTPLPTDRPQVGWPFHVAAMSLPIRHSSRTRLAHCSYFIVHSAKDGEACLTCCAHESMLVTCQR